MYYGAISIVLNYDICLINLISFDPFSCFDPLIMPPLILGFHNFDAINVLSDFSSK